MPQLAQRITRAKPSAILALYSANRALRASYTCPDAALDDGLARPRPCSDELR